MSLIKMTNVVKEFFHPVYDIKRAVAGISLSIERGELVGYIGPNGAGKSTTIKMLTGILVPTCGEVLVDGRPPYANRRANALRMGGVFGQRSQLLWDLPVSDTLDLYQKMYRIEPTRYKQNRDFYIELLDMSGFIHQPGAEQSVYLTLSPNNNGLGNLYRSHLCFLRLKYCLTAERTTWHIALTRTTTICQNPLIHLPSYCFIDFF